MELPKRLGMICLVAVCCWGRVGSAGEAWPTYRGDNTRRGWTEQTLGRPLALQWTHVSAHRPRPAWPEPGKEVHRMAFDYAYRLAAAGGRIYYGSSADHKVYALDVESGKEVWSFFTEGPVRFAPCVAGGRVFAASDDGFLYCLDAAEGKLIWRFRGGPRDERMVGNEQMISRWPGRSGVLVEGEVAYFTAGMWGPDGVYVYALRTADGSVIWKNNTANYQYQLMPHNNYEGITGVSPQGYPALDDGVLLTPTGRAMPARFDAATGELLPWNIAWGKHHRPGGAWTMTAKGLFFNACRRSTGLPVSSLGPDSRLRPEGLMAWDLRTGKAAFAIYDVYRAAYSDETLYLTGASYAGPGQGHVMAVDFESISKKVEPAPPHADGHDGAGFAAQKLDKQAKWLTQTGRIYELIGAGDVLVAGGNRAVVMLDARTGKEFWKTEVDGQARELAVASGRLLVSTSTGRIYCFGPGRAGKAADAVPAPRRKPQAPKPADGIVEECGIRAGYCLVLGLDDPNLPLQLIRQSNVDVIVLAEDAQAIAAARRRYDELGLYGVRIVVHRGNLKKLPYAPYFANFIVAPNPRACDPKDVYRCLRPCGGILAVPAGDDSDKAARRWLLAAGADEGAIVTGGGLVRTRRGPLPDSDDWSHPFANAGRTSASRDKLVRLPLKTLWFGGPGPAPMVDRHRYPPIPVAANGRLFVPAQDQIIALDAYNGREMWTRELKGVGRFPGQDRGPSVVADEKCAYVPHGLKCVRLDGDTGAILREYVPPAELPPPAPAAPSAKKPKSGGRRAVFNEVEWNYLAVTEKVVLGTVGEANVRKSMANWPIAAPQGKILFALDKESGEKRWVYTAEHAVTPKCIVADDERVYVLDQENLAGALGRSVIRAIDIDTGKVAWSKPSEGRWELLLSGDRLVAAGAGYTVYDARTGEQRWAQIVAPELFDAYGPGIHHYRWSLGLRDFPVVPPMIVNGLIVAPPRAFDLETGEQKHRPCPLSGEEMLPFGVGNGGCGTYSACPSLMFMRSGSLGIYDVAGQTGMHWLGQTRPGCWINTLPAGGVVLMPEASSTCTCAYSFQTSLALVPATRHEEWGVYTCQPPLPGSRIKTLALNFGAVGDKRDADGKLWLGFPRAFSPQALNVPVGTHGPATYYRENADEVAIGSASRPWLYSGGVKGMTEVVVDLELTRPAVAPRAAEPPRIDGKLDDACWDAAEEVRFVDDSRRIAPGIRAWLRHDAKNLYVGFRREAPRKDGKPAPWTMNTTGDGDAPAWRDDSLKVRFHSGPASYAYLLLSASGARFTGSGSKSSTIKPAGKQVAWRSGAHVTDEVWTAEIAIPFAGPAKGQQIFLESFNRSGVGPERAFYKSRSWRRWFVTGGEADLVFQRPETPPKRRFAIRLHFAEPEGAKPGERVFDVEVQGKKLIESLDIAAAAGRDHKALTREIRGVEATGTISIRLVPSASATRPAILNAMEIEEQP